jgi:hypothetical protein
MDGKNRYPFPHNNNKNRENERNESTYKEKGK